MHEELPVLVALGQTRPRFRRSPCATRRCLTIRSSGHAPARHLGREALRSIIRLAAKLPHRRVPLSSNVRQQRAMPEVRLRLCAAMGREDTASSQARCPSLRHRLVLRVPPALAKPHSTALVHTPPTTRSWSVPVLSSQAGVLPNPSLEATVTGKALGPRGARCHHPPRGPSATPPRAPQLKR